MQDEDFKDGLKSLLKHMKKNFSCNGSISINDDKEKIISLQGDHKDKISQLLQSKFEYGKQDIIIHG